MKPIIEKNPKGLEVHYYDDSHQYILQDPNKNLISGTTFIKKFFKPFDVEKMSMICASKRGISQADMKAEWKENGRIASEHGTRVHNFMEAYIKTGNITRALTEKERNYNTAILKFMVELLKEYEIVYSEKIVFDKNLAGTLDLLLRSLKTPKEYLLADFKTNKDLNIENKYNNYAYRPISHIEDSNFGHYNIQLSLYQYLLIKEKYLPKDIIVKRSILHITEKEVLEYKIDYLEKEVIDMYKAYFN